MRREVKTWIITTVEVSWWNYFSSSPSWHWLNWRKTQLSDLHSMRMQQKLKHKPWFLVRGPGKEGPANRKVWEEITFLFSSSLFLFQCCPKISHCQKGTVSGNSKMADGEALSQESTFFLFPEELQKETPIVQSGVCAWNLLKCFLLLLWLEDHHSPIGARRWC